MTRAYLFVFAICSVLFSCDLDQCEQTVTYTKATGVYIDLDDTRSQSLMQPPKSEISSPGKIFINDDLILIGERGEGVHVINNTIPESPVTMSFINVPGSHEMYVREDYLYINSYFDMLKINIADASAISLAERIEDAFENPYITDNEGRVLVDFDYQVVTEVQNCDQSYYADDQIYYFDFEGTLLDQSAIPTSFVSSGTTIGTANRMAVIGDQLYAVNKRDLYAFDIEADQFSPAVGFSRQPYIGWNIETIYAMEPYLFIGTQTGMQIHRVGNNNIVTEGVFSHAEACDPVLPTDEGVAYVTLRSGDDCPGDLNSLNIVDISNVSFPTLLQQYPLDSPYGMTLIGDLLYVAQGASGISVFDKSNLPNVSLVEYFPSIAAYDIIKHPSRTDLVLVANDRGLSQYSVSTDLDFGEISTIGF